MKQKMKYETGGTNETDDLSWIHKGSDLSWVKDIDQVDSDNPPLGAYGNYSHYTSKKVLCTHKAKHVFTLRGTKNRMLEIWASDRWGATHFPDNALVLNCTGTSHAETNLGPFPDLAQFIKKYTEIVLPWDDGQAPPLAFNFWETIYDKVIDSKYAILGAHCLGGHGRTGTALAALLIRVGGYDAELAIDTVRDLWCKDSVETLSQENYLHDLASNYK